MSPLTAFLIGVDPRDVTDVRTELSARGIAIETEFKTSTEAAARVTLRDEPNRLLIVDNRSSADGTAIREIRKAYPSWPLLALVEGSCSAATLIAINRAGADQVVSIPLNRHDFGEALDLLTSRSQSDHSSSLLVVVSGVIHGCGCSTLAANLATEFARGQRMRTILIEASLQMSVQALNLNVQPKMTLNDLFGDGESVTADQVRKALTPIAPGFQLLAGPQDFARPGQKSVASVLKVIKLCKELAGAVVVDVPCLYDDMHFEILWAADQVVLIADQSIPAIRTTRMILEAIARAKTVKAVHVVLNRYEPTIEGLTATKIAETLGGINVKTVPNDYAGVMQAASEGRTLQSFAPDSPISVSVRSLVTSILGQTAAPEPKSSNFFARLIGPLKRLGGV